MAVGRSLEDAFKPIEADLDTVFSKWSGIRRHLESA
jgi:hypothetical protein